MSQPAGALFGPRQHIEAQHLLQYLGSSAYHLRTSVDANEDADQIIGDLVRLERDVAAMRAHIDRAVKAKRRADTVR